MDLKGEITEKPHLSWIYAYRIPVHVNVDSSRTPRYTGGNGSVYLVKVGVASIRDGKEPLQARLVEEFKTLASIELEPEFHEFKSGPSRSDLKAARDLRSYDPKLSPDLLFLAPTFADKGSEDLIRRLVGLSTKEGFGGAKRVAKLLLGEEKSNLGATEWVICSASTYQCARKWFFETLQLDSWSREEVWRSLVRNLRSGRRPTPAVKYTALFTTNLVVEPFQGETGWPGGYPKLLKDLHANVAGLPKSNCFLEQVFLGTHFWGRMPVALDKARGTQYSKTGTAKALENAQAGKLQIFYLSPETARKMAEVLCIKAGKPYVSVLNRLMGKKCGRGWSWAKGKEEEGKDGLLDPDESPGVQNLEDSIVNKLCDIARIERGRKSLQDFVEGKGRLCDKEAARLEYIRMGGEVGKIWRKRVVDSGIFFLP